MPPPLLAWSLMLAALIHIFEEFVFPGGFKAWWCAYRPEITGSVTNRFLIIINVVLVLFSANVALASQARRGNGVAAWLALAALLAFNAVFHLVGSIQTRRYSPGMISGLLLHRVAVVLHPAARHLRLRILPSQREGVVTDSCNCSGGWKLILFHFHGESPS